VKNIPPLERLSFELHPGTPDERAVYRKFLKPHARLAYQNFLLNQPKVSAHFPAKLPGFSRPSEGAQRSRALPVEHINLRRDELLSNNCKYRKNPNF